ncbi:ATP-binding protein [Streptomyces sp. 5-8]|uniref:ATP-binding protein n=1 Tax=Streptomyces musisoli TaxID=2802280 RepID=A0ABS1P4F2_9ACTN|nr:MULTISPECIES: ATP-binding protein [Streptomyces]MBL1107188.1 ATP-binding protein [Streptomyces musisoli]MBY8844527.1 ATP-binding protein [Streptomyces sp. SP2-10]
MSTTRPYSPGDRGPEPSGASGASEGAEPAVGAATGAAAPSVPTGGAPQAQGRQVRTLRLEGESGVVPLARDFSRQALYAWGWLPAATADQRAAAEDVLLVVSELVTNACLHAEGPDELLLACDNKVIRIEVSDRGTGQPAPRNPHRAGRPGGHGMFIVQRLCLDWGVVRVTGAPGKTVWAELGAPA